MLETIGEVFPEAKYQRCIVHFYRNVFSVVPRGRIRAAALMLKAIHAQEDKAAARRKALQVVEKLREMKLAAAAKKVGDSIEETLTYMDVGDGGRTDRRTGRITAAAERKTDFAKPS